MATKSQKKQAGTSLALFKAWLAGIEEMQGEDWYPNAEQWRRIKEKLMSVEEAVAPEPEQPYRQPVMQYQQPQAFLPAPVMQAHNSAMQFANPAGGQLPGVRTPDIDSTGGYESGLI